MYLMLYDKEVLYFDLDDFIVEEINSELLPFYLRGAFKKDSSMKSILHNINILKSYLSSRLLSLSRDNAKLLYSAFGIPQVNNIDIRVDTCIKCMGVSISDSYWVKTDDFNKPFKDVNVRLNKFKEIVDISLNGKYPSFTVDYKNPELTTHGLFRKAWVRREDGLYLLKSDKHINNINTKMEVLSSSILDCFYNKIDIVKYTGDFINIENCTLYVDSCKNFVSEKYSFVEAYDVMEYCRRIGMSFVEFFGRDYISSSIAVIDFLLSNTDRHSQNYGFLMDNITGEIVGLAPLFDFNCALVSDIINIDVSDTLSQMFNDGRSIIEVAKEYISSSSLELDITKFNMLREEYKEYSIVFDNIIKRCNYFKIKEI